MQRTGDLKLIQELNRSIILKTIQKYGPISRIEIARRNKISSTTVTSAVKILIKQGLVFEEGVGKSTGGRKPILIRFASDIWFIIAVVITNKYIEIAEMSLEAIAKRQKKYNINDLEGKLFVDYLLKSINKFFKAYTDFKKCIGISIITPGTIDIKKAIIIENTKLKLRNVNLKEILEKQFKLKVWLENDANAGVLAEKEYGAYKKFKNLIYITVGDGIGAGIMVNEQIYRGSNGGAGEFGHTSIDLNGISCDCGNRGCLENYISWPVIYSKILHSIAQGKSTMMLKLAKGDKIQITSSIFRYALEKNDQLAIEIIVDVSKYLAIGIINLINLINPNAIILGGEIAHNNYFLVSKIKEIVLKQALKISTDKLKIGLNSLGENFGIIAATSIPLHEMFNFYI